MLGEYLNSICFTKQNLMTTGDAPEAAAKQYPAFMVARCLSYHRDCVLYVNEINKNGLVQFGVSPEMHYSFLLNTISKKKRFAKLAKAPKPTEIIEALQTIYGYSRRRAEESAEMLTDSELADLVSRVQKGGKK